MGLDVVGYSRHGAERRRVLREFGVGGEFADRALDICGGVLYSYTERSAFRAGSYSGYNVWRNSLARVAGYSPLTDGRYDEGAWAATGGPFWEMINFTDCDGVLGTAVCKKLCADFVAWHDIAREQLSDGDVLTYEQFKTTFELAADGGCVVFC